MPLTLSGSNGISAGNTNWVLNPQSSGRFNLANNPCFYAFFPTGLATTTSNFVFPFNTTRINVGNHYSTSTFRFTAPIAGIYEFHAALLYRVNGPLSQIECSFFRNQINVGNRGQMYIINPFSNGHTHGVMHLIIELAANDTMETRLLTRVGGDIYYGENLSYFSGKLIG